MIGSRSDLGQCAQGLKDLRAAHQDGLITIVSYCVEVSSIHRATEDTLELLRSYHADPEPIILITGAGWANHLSGVCDAYLRYHLLDTKVVVIGVSFEDLENNTHTLAATLSVSQVPGTQVVFSDCGEQFVGHIGFQHACQLAIEGKLPDIKQPKPKPHETIPLDEAIEIGDGMNAAA
jgi:phosphoribosylcarboxyaminoimidazole (NCAIR) mutase